MSRHRAPSRRCPAILPVLGCTALLAVGFPASASAGEAPDSLGGLGCTVSADVDADVSAEAVTAAADVVVCGSSVAVDL